MVLISKKLHTLTAALLTGQSLILPTEGMWLSKSSRNAAANKILIDYGDAHSSATNSNTAYVNMNNNANTGSSSSRSLLGKVCNGRIPTAIMGVGGVCSMVALSKTNGLKLKTAAELNAQDLQELKSGAALGAVDSQLPQHSIPNLQMQRLSNGEMPKILSLSDKDYSADQIIRKMEQMELV